MNKNDHDWMHRDVVGHPKFEETFEEEYKRIQEQTKKDNFDRAFRIEMAKHNDPEIATQEAKRNLEADPGFYDNMEE